MGNLTNWSYCNADRILAAAGALAAFVFGFAESGIVAAVVGAGIMAAFTLSIRHFARVDLPPAS